MISLKPTRLTVAPDTRQRFFFSFTVALFPRTSALFARPESRFTFLKNRKAPCCPDLQGHSGRINVLYQQ
jgi:hypothetical protein